MIEQEHVEVSSGKWASITKKHWEPQNMERGFVVPVLQACVFAVSPGVVVAFLCASFGVGFVSVVVGLVVFVSVASCVSVLMFSRARDALSVLEIYESESAQGGMAEKKTMRIEFFDPKNGRMVNDELNISPDLLEQIIISNVALSRRGLASLGCSESKASEIVELLIDKGYAGRDNKNSPVYWKSKGRALFHAFNNGGGVVVGALNHENVVVDVAEVGG